MKKFFTYLSLLLCFLVSCQTAQLEESPVGGDAATGEVTVFFNDALPHDGLVTKARGDEPASDIKNMYLIIFDENGYYVETCKADFVNDDGTISDVYTGKYKVTLHKTDKLRIIHFVANCPVEQVRYGHETEVISNMYSTNNEAAYWYRMSVWYVLTKDELVNGHEVLVDEIAAAFNNIPLLRNYAQVSVRKDPALTDFVLESYAVYNTIDKGTIAPYCSEHHEFQSFINADGTLLEYDDHLTEYHEYRGHVLFDAELNSSLTESDLLSPEVPTYMYERKISVRTDEEHKWGESPAHIIIKGRYKNAASSYYKIDMVRMVSKDGETPKVEYYNILRNFNYIFTLSSISGNGYSSLKEAMDRPAGNNLSGATDTQGYTNVSDGLGRIFVSFADTTLVSGDPIKLRYKYIPSVVTGDIQNGNVSVSGILDGTGSVLKSVISHVNDAGDGWAEVVFDVQEPGAISHMQEITLLVKDNTNLHKNVRFRLQNPYDLNLECTPNHVEMEAEIPMSVLIRIPDHLTENVFPLDFYIETEDLTLSPDAFKNVMPVEPGVSIIPRNDGKTKNSYQFVRSLETFEDYLALPVVNKQRVLATHWLTNKRENASTVYVYNKYFNLNSVPFYNGPGFSDLSFPNGVRKEEGVATDFTFYMNMTGDVTVSLSKGLSGTPPTRATEYAETFTYTATTVGAQKIVLYTTSDISSVERVEVNLLSRVSSTGNDVTAIKSEAPSNAIIIPELTVDFWYYYSYSPDVNSITPELTVNGATVTYGELDRSRTGSSRNYHYKIVYNDVKITGASQSSTMNVSLTYNNNHNGIYTYTGSKTISELITNPYISITE